MEHKRSSDVLEVSKRLLEVSIGDVLFIRKDITYWYLWCSKRVVRGSRDY